MASFSNTSLLTLKTRDRMLIASDSRWTGEWLNVVSDNDPKIFRLRGNLFMGFSGNSAVFVEIRRRMNELFFPGQTVPNEAWGIDAPEHIQIIPDNLTVELVANEIRQIADQHLHRRLRQTRRQYPDDDEKQAETVRLFTSGIFVVGWNYEQRRHQRQRRMPSAFVVSTHVNPYGSHPYSSHSIREEVGVMECLGSGTPHMIQYYYDNARIRGINERMTEEVAIQFAKDAIEYASMNNDWGTGGKIQIVVISATNCRAKRYKPIDPERCLSGYVTDDDTNRQIR